MTLSALCTKYPTAYGRIHFECGEGWLDILDELGAVLERHGAVVGQCKEKSGGLRCYLDVEPEDDDAARDVDQAIHAAEARAWKTCEACGKPGQRRGGGWIQTLCDGCAEGRK